MKCEDCQHFDRAPSWCERYKRMLTRNEDGELINRCNIEQFKKGHMTFTVTAKGVIIHGKLLTVKDLQTIIEMSNKLKETKE